MDTVVTAENLSKRYYLNRSAGLRLKSSFGRWFRNQIPLTRDHWALKNLTFKIYEGESVGVIGPNGAGKSTLLKILSNVTKPTSGFLDIRGRVGALIKLGISFHPELSGRENIFLSGSFLGIRKREINQKLDEIVSFAEIEPFIDTPVKHYSSGMFVRLAFSVAVHIAPDILVIDEILAVGDLSFQRKCFEWIRTYLKSGKTLFLVSHQIHQIEKVCSRVFYLREGEIVYDGVPDRAISRYLNDFSSECLNESTQIMPGYRKQLEDFEILELSLLNADNKSIHEITFDQPLIMRIDFHAITRIPSPKIEIALNWEGIRIGQANTISDGAAPKCLESKGSITFRWSRCILTPNYYTVDIYISDGTTGADICAWVNAISFQVLPPDGFKIASGDPGLIRISGDWSFQLK
jgi:lipopolysaccharide transport system ATP-binding protein